ncbi:MAG: ArsA-related P-loop ATPase [Candidatus Binataceae bacterium]
MAPPRLIFVTGKGGTGKSTVAAALASALSRIQRTTLAELEGRPLTAHALVDHDGAEPARNHLEVTALSARAELEGFIQRIVPLKAISRRMLKSRTFGYVTAALPGLEAFLMLERLRLMATNAALEDRFIVIDGPATGGALELLSVQSGIKALAPFGTLNRLAVQVGEFLNDPTLFAVLLTVSPEELAVRETLQAVTTLREKLGIECLATVLNGVATSPFSEAEIAALKAAGPLAEIAVRRRAMAEAAGCARRELRRAGMPLVELPMLFETVLGRAQLGRLSLVLADALVKL